MAELNEEQLMNDQEAQHSDESLVYLIHRALVFSRVKKENRYTVVRLKLRGRWFV